MGEFSIPGVELVFLVGGGLGSVLVMLPSLLGALGLGKATSSLDGGAADVEFDRSDPLLADAARRLRGLGFEPLGREHERVTLFGPHLVWNSPVQWVFANPRERCFASLYRIFASEPPKLGLKTRFDDDTLLWTSTGTPDGESLPDYPRQQIDTDNYAEVLAHHRAAVDRLQADGHRPCAGLGLDDARAATQLGLDKHARAGSFRRTSVALLKAYAINTVWIGAGMFVMPVFGGELSVLQRLSVATLSSAVLVMGGLRMLRWGNMWSGYRKARSLRAKLATDANF